MVLQTTTMTLIKIILTFNNDEREVVDSQRGIDKNYDNGNYDISRRNDDKKYGIELNNEHKRHVSEINETMSIIMT